MKRIFAIFLSAALLVMFGACGANVSGTKNTEAPAATTDVLSASESQELPSDTPSPTDAQESEKPDSADAAPELSVILSELEENCHPGTAGSSLIAVSYAGRLLNWYITFKPDYTSAKTYSETFASTVEDGNELQAQLDLVYYTAQELCGDTYEELLETAGYEANHAPWFEDDAAALFTAIYDGLGLTIPETVA